MEKGDYEKAKSLFDRVLSVQENKPESNPLRLGNALVDVASVYYRKKEYDKAEPYLKRELNISEKMFSVDNDRIARDLSNLGDVYYRMGEYLQALAQFWRHRLNQQAAPNDSLSLGA